MSEINLERLMMLYFETRHKKELAAKQERFREYINQDFRLTGIEDCIRVVTDTPIEKLETKYSYLL